jgi:hypothetical protein
MPKNDKPAFRFRGAKRTVEETTRRAKRSGAGYDSITDADIPLFKPREGENTIRIMPPTWEDDKWGDYWDIEVWVHYDVGAQGGSYLCLDKMKQERCPVCEAARDAADKDEARQFKPNVRALCWLIDRNDEKAGPMVWSMPNKMYKEINARSKDKKTGAVILIDQAEKDSLDGYDVTFTREGTKLNTDYSGVEIDRDPTPLHDDEKIEDRWMKYIEGHPLPDILQFYDVDYIEKVLMGRAEPKHEEAEDETEQETPPSRRRRPAAEEPEEEAEEAPPSSRRRPRNPEPEEAEDEPEERPSTRRRPTNREAEEDNEGAEAAASTRSRRRPVAEEDEAEDDTGTEKISAQARRKLDRLKERHAR